jgi:polysaccharide pyruvyl transferase WcaK-like protein
MPADLTVSRRTRRIRVGLLGPYHSRNLGDTAIQMAVITNLRSCWPEVEILGICWDPDDATRCHGIRAVSLLGDSPSEPPKWAPDGASVATRLRYRMRWAWHRLGLKSGFIGLRRLCRVSAVVRDLDLLLISGSGQLDDFWGGPWRHPYALLAWTSLARLHGVRTAVFGIGLDGLDTRLGRWFAFSAMRLAQERYFRDSGTVDVLHQAGIKGALRAGPDPAFGLEPPRASPPGASTTPAAPTVMLCPITYKAWLSEPTGEYQSYLATLTAVCAALIRAGVKVVLAFSQSANDRPITHAIREELRREFGDDIPLSVEDTSSVESYLHCAARADVVVASRLHSVILAALATTPVIAVSYARKVKVQMSDLGLDRYSFDLDALEARALEQAVWRAWKEKSAIQLHLAEVMKRFRAVLAEEYLRLKILVAGE